MDGLWLTYQDLGVRLGVTPEAAKRRAIQAKWARMPGNDGRARVRVPDELRASSTLDVRPAKVALQHALESHVETLRADVVALKAQLAAAEARAAEEANKTTRAIAAFADLARRLNALAAERERQPPPPWWRRLRITG
jgi:hypothetical protein